jgi:hypothetical protein
MAVFITDLVEIIPDIADVRTHFAGRGGFFGQLALGALESGLQVVVFGFQQSNSVLEPFVWRSGQGRLQLLLDAEELGAGGGGLMLGFLGSGVRSLGLGLGRLNLVPVLVVLGDELVVFGGELMVSRRETRHLFLQRCDLGVQLGLNVAETGDGGLGGG